MNIKRKALMHITNICRTVALMICTHMYISPLIEKGFSIHLISELICTTLIFEVIHLLIDAIISNYSKRKGTSYICEIAPSITSSIICTLIVCTVFTKNI